MALALHPRACVTSVIDSRAEKYYLSGFGRYIDFVLESSLNADLPTRVVQQQLFAVFSEKDYLEGIIKFPKSDRLLVWSLTRVAVVPLSSLQHGACLCLEQTASLDVPTDALRPLSLVDSISFINEDEFRLLYGGSYIRHKITFSNGQLTLKRMNDFSGCCNNLWDGSPYVKWRSTFAEQEHKVVTVIGREIHVVDLDGNNHVIVPTGEKLLKRKDVFDVLIYGKMIILLLKRKISLYSIPKKQLLHSMELYPPINTMRIPHIVGYRSPVPRTKYRLIVRSKKRFFTVSAGYLQTWTINGERLVRLREDLLSVDTISSIAIVNEEMLIGGSFGGFSRIPLANISSESSSTEKQSIRCGLSQVFRVDGDWYGVNNCCNFLFRTRNMRKKVCNLLYVIAVNESTGDVFYKVEDGYERMRLTQYGARDVVPIVIPGAKEDMQAAFMGRELMVDNGVLMIFSTNGSCIAKFRCEQDKSAEVGEIEEVNEEDEVQLMANQWLRATDTTQAILLAVDKNFFAAVSIPLPNDSKQGKLLIRGRSNYLAMGYYTNPSPTTVPAGKENEANAVPVVNMYLQKVFNAQMTGHHRPTFGCGANIMAAFAAFSGSTKSADTEMHHMSSGEPVRGIHYDSDTNRLLVLLCRGTVINYQCVWGRLKDVTDPANLVCLNWIGSRQCPYFHDTHAMFVHDKRVMVIGANTPYVYQFNQMLQLNKELEDEKTLLIVWDVERDTVVGTVQVNMSWMDLRHNFAYSIFIKKDRSIGVQYAHVLQKQKTTCLEKWEIPLLMEKPIYLPLLSEPSHEIATCSLPGGNTLIAAVGDMVTVLLTQPELGRVVRLNQHKWSRFYSSPVFTQISSNSRCVLAVGCRDGVELLQIALRNGLPPSGDGFPTCSMAPLCVVHLGPAPSTYQLKEHLSVCPGGYRFALALEQDCSGDMEKIGNKLHLGMLYRPACDHEDLSDVSESEAEEDILVLSSVVAIEATWNGCQVTDVKTLSPNSGKMVDPNLKCLLGKEGRDGTAIRLFGYLTEKKDIRTFIYEYRVNRGPIEITGIMEQEHNNLSNPVMVPLWKRQDAIRCILDSKGDLKTLYGSSPLASEFSLGDCVEEHPNMSAVLCVVRDKFGCPVVHEGVVTHVQTHNCWAFVYANSKLPTTMAERIGNCFRDARNNTAPYVIDQMVSLPDGSLLLGGEGLQIVSPCIPCLRAAFRATYAKMGFR